MQKTYRGNPYRCRTCGCLAGKDNVCKNHRRDLFPHEDLPETKRPNFMEYGGFIGKKSFFSAQYGVVRDKFPIERKHGE